LGHTPRAVAAAALSAAAVLLATTVSGCGNSGSTGKASASHPAAKPATCAQLYARLQQVTQAISANSELIANSLNPQQLSERIAAEEKVDVANA
jgi:hypothetical protein